MLQTESKLNNGPCSLVLLLRPRTSVSRGHTGALLILCLLYTLLRPLKEAIHTHVILLLLLLFPITLHLHDLQTIANGHLGGWRSRLIVGLKAKSWITGGSRRVRHQSVAPGIFTWGLSSLAQTHFRFRQICVASQSPSVRGAVLLTWACPRKTWPWAEGFSLCFFCLFASSWTAWCLSSHISLCCSAFNWGRFKHLNITMSYSKRSTLTTSKGENWTQTWKSGSLSSATFAG